MRSFEGSAHKIKGGKMKKILIWLKETTQPIEYDDVDNTYEKGSFFCLHHASRVATKYPIANIWRVVEDHSDKPKVIEYQKE